MKSGRRRKEPVQFAAHVRDFLRRAGDPVNQSLTPATAWNGERPARTLGEVLSTLTVVSRMRWGLHERATQHALAECLTLRAEILPAIMLCLLLLCTRSPLAFFLGKQAEAVCCWCSQGSLG